MKQLAIIIPAYKDTFLRQALDSIAAQTCQDFSLYIGDDCSPYDIGTIVNEYKDKIDLVYKRFDTNLGGKDLVAQWERCIDMSQDEPYIWLFSDDDVMEPRCVEAFLNLEGTIRENYLIHFDIKIIDELKAGAIRKEVKYPKTMSGTEFLRLKMEGKINSYVVEYIIPRNVFMQGGRFQNFDLAWGSDILTWFKLGNQCKGLYSIDSKDANVRWRSSDVNISPNKSYLITKRKMFAIVENARFVQNKLTEYGLKKDFCLNAKQVWTTIVRNSYMLSLGDIHDIYNIYVDRVGFPVRSTLYYIITICNKYLKIFK